MFVGSIEDKKKSIKKRIQVSIIVITAALLSYQIVSYFSQEGTIQFFKGIWRNPTYVGAIAPCSQAVAEETVSYLKASNQDFVNVLEVGGGTGQFTKTIEKTLQNLLLEGKIKNYKVDVIEIDSEYCTELTRMFSHNKNITIHCKDASVGFNAKYDFIISSLPFTNLPVDLVQKILTNYQQSIVSGGIVSYIEHKYLPVILSKFLFGKKFEEFCSRKKIINDFRESGACVRNTVWKNIIPMFVYHI